MSSVNKVILVGRLGSDPEVRETNNRKVVANFSIATDFKVNGEKVTEWHRLILWERLAEVAEEYLHKGDQIYVEGRIQSRDYEDAKTGTTKHLVEIVVGSLTMLNTGNQDAPAARPAARAATNTRTAARPVNGRQAAPARRARPAPADDGGDPDDGPGF